MAFLISKLQLGQDEMPFEHYLITDLAKTLLKLNIACQSWLYIVLGHRIEPPLSDFNAKLMDSLDVDERPPPIVKLADF